MFNILVDFLKSKMCTCLIETTGRLDGDLEVPLVLACWLTAALDFNEVGEVIRGFFVLLLPCSGLVGSKGRPCPGRLYLQI